MFRSGTWPKHVGINVILLLQFLIVIVHLVGLVFFIYIYIYSKSSCYPVSFEFFSLHRRQWKKITKMCFAIVCTSLTSLTLLWYKCNAAICDTWIPCCSHSMQLFGAKCCTYRTVWCSQQWTLCNSIFMQLTFKLQSSADHYRHWILVPKD
jgi:hypothetical protein